MKDDYDFPESQVGLFAHTWILDTSENDSNSFKCICRSKFVYNEHFQVYVVNIFGFNTQICKTKNEIPKCLLSKNEKMIGSIIL